MQTRYPETAKPEETAAPTLPDEEVEQSSSLVWKPSAEQPFRFAVDTRFFMSRLKTVGGVVQEFIERLPGEEDMDRSQHQIGAVGG